MHECEVRYQARPLLRFRWALQSGQHGFAPCHDDEPRAIGQRALANPCELLRAF